MSFSSNVKDEASKTKEYDAKTELLALLRLNSSIIFNNGMTIQFETSNISVAKRFVANIKKLYKEADIELYTKETTTLNKSKMCVVQVKQAKDIISDFKLLAFTNYEEINDKIQISSYLRGAFLINGSINNPEKSHHLEIRCKENKDAIFVQKLMNDFDLNSKIGKRRNELIVYLKDSEKIQDFLYIISAPQSYFKYNEILINRKVVSDVKKAINCELFNASKSLNAGSNQLQDIAIIEKYNIKVDEKIQELINYRKEYIDASLNELVSLYKENGKAATKSALNHRFRKIHEIALKLTEQNEEK